MRERLAGRAIRGAPRPPARGGLPDARLAERGRRCRAGGVAAAQPRRRRAAIENLGGWLTTVVARVCLEHAALARRRGARSRSACTCPSRSSSRADGVDPEHEALLADSVGLALLVVLETLTPAERLAFVLHDMFAVPFDEIAPIVGRSPAAARQLASRARRRVQGERRVPDADLGTPARGRRRVPRRRRAAATSRRCVAVLDPDVVLRADFGPLPTGGWRGGPWRRGGRRLGARLLADRPGPAPGAHQRRRGGRLHARRRAVLGGGRHGPGREDRRHRHPRRP